MIEPEEGGQGVWDIGTRKPRKRLGGGRDGGMSGSSKVSPMRRSITTALHPTLYITCISLTGGKIYFSGFHLNEPAMRSRSSKFKPRLCAANR